MFGLTSLRAQHDLISDNLTISGDAGLKLTFSHFDGYSPLLDGSVRTVVSEKSHYEKSGVITIAVSVKASSPSCKISLLLDMDKC